MILHLNDGSAKISEWQGITLFENLYDSNITDIKIDAQIEDMIKILRFYNRHFNIESAHNQIISAPAEALNIFRNIKKESWLRLVKLALFLKYDNILNILFLSGRLLF